MSRTPTKNLGQPKTAFTLIELLTVIAVIGILAAILIPTVSKIRSSAHASACVANLRSMQMANQLYAAQNGGKFLSNVKFDGDSNLISGSLWFQDGEYYELLTSLRPEARSDGFGGWHDDLLCPTTESLGSPNAYDIRGNYGINYMLNPDWGIPNAQMQPNQYKVEKPNNTVAFGDTVDWLLTNVTDYTEDMETSPLAGGGYLAYRHNGRAHVVYFDASVDSVSREDTADPEILKRFTGN